MSEKPAAPRPSDSANTGNDGLPTGRDSVAAAPAAAGDTSVARAETTASRDDKRASSERRRTRGERSYATRPEQRDLPRQERRLARTRDDEDGREFVDAHGVRHIILSRRGERSERGELFAESGRDRGGLDGLFRPRRFFIFGPPVDDDED